MSAPRTGSGPAAAAPGLPTSPLLERVRRGVIGEGELMDGPFGPRRVTYADYTASGRSLDFLEDFIRDAVLPRFGIQARGGCSCAGPYGHRLLSIGPAHSHAFREEIGHGCDGIKPTGTAPPPEAQPGAALRATVVSEPRRRPAGAAAPARCSRR